MIEDVYDFMRQHMGETLMLTTPDGKYVKVTVTSVNLHQETVTAYGPDNTTVFPKLYQEVEVDIKVLDESVGQMKKHRLPPTRR